MEYFIFNGIKSTDMNIVIKNLPPITRANQRINTIELEGRSGTLHEIEDKFDSYNIQIECILMPDADINEIKKWLIGQSGLILSSNPNIMHVATIVNKINFTKYLTFLREFPLELEIQPIAYSIDELRYIFDKNMNKCIQNIIIYGDLQQETSTPDSTSPDNPSPIEVVGENVNFFDKNGEKTNIYIGADGSEIVSTGNTFIKQELIPTSKKYVMSYLKNIGNAYVRISYYKEDTFISREISIKNKFVFTVPDGCTKIDIRVDNEEKKYFTKLKLEKGSTPTSYTSHGCGGIDYKNVGKNLIGIKNSSSSTGFGVTVDYDNSTGIYTLNGTSTSALYIKLYDILEVLNYSNFVLKERTKMHKGNYVFSYKYISGAKTDGTANVMVRDSNSTSTVEKYEISNIGTADKQIIFTTNNDYLTQKYIWINNGITFTNFKFSIQLEIDTTLSEHEPYKEQSATVELPNGEFMAKIGDIEDYIDNKGVLNKYIGKILLNGSENWNKNSTLGFFMELPLAKPNTKVFSTHYKHSFTTWAENGIGVSVTGNLWVGMANYTLSDFKSWLAEQYANGTSVEVYYVLAEPYAVNLTDEQKEKYLSLPLFEGVNNIETSAEISFEAYITLEDKVSFTKVKEANFERISQPNIITINSTYKTYPLLKVIGNGSITCNNRTIKVINNDDYLYIDCELQNAYKGEENKNNCVNGLEEPIYLECGENEIELIGVSVELIYKEAWL